MKWSDAAENITTVILDIDGVLTNGTVYYGPDITLKGFDVQDGHAIKMALRAGLKVGILSGRADAVNQRRADELGMSFAYMGAKNKLDTFQKLLAENDLAPEECLYIGDDVVDIPVMRACALGIAVRNAVEEVKEIADVIATNAGGAGAVREILVRLLKAQKKWNQQMVRYMPELAQQDS